MKKFLSIFIVLAMIFSFPVSSFADVSAPQTELRTISTGNQTFNISESINENYVIERSYHRTNSTNLAEISEEDSMYLLNSLGLTDDIVQAMSEDAINAFLNAEDIFVSCSYTKYNEASHETTYLPADVAIAEAQSLKQEKLNYYINSSENPVNTRANVDMPGRFQDNYMLVTHAAAYLGNGEYKYITNANWLIMPTFRGVDSIGSCSKGQDANYFTAYGRYWYKTFTINAGNISEPVSSGYINIDNIQSPINGDWYGCAGVFNLPNDFINPSTGYEVRHYDFRAHFEYDGAVEHPELITNFSSNGSYSHSTIALSFTPSVSIDLNNNIGGCIGINVIGAKDTRTARLNVTYDPKY